jgi:hypothetical protein
MEKGSNKRERFRRADWATSGERTTWTFEVTTGMEMMGKGWAALNSG